MGQTVVTQKTYVWQKKKRNKKENCIEGSEQKDEAKREKGGEEEKM